MTPTTDPTREASHRRTASVTGLSAPANAVETLLANTINAETRLIEEGAPLPAFLRFESGPWTVFYMAGENIRELRKAEASKRVSLPAMKNDTRKAA